MTGLDAGTPNPQVGEVVHPPSCMEEARALSAIVLGWAQDGELPHLEEAENAVVRFTAYGMDLRAAVIAVCRSLPRDSDRYASTEATLGEADRRLNLPPPAKDATAATSRAQNLARLVQALIAAVERTPHLRSDPTGGAHSQPTAKGRPE